MMATLPTEVPVVDFLDRVHHKVRRADADTLVSMMSEVSGQPPVMWGPSIIRLAGEHHRRALRRLPLSRPARRILNPKG